MDKSIQLQDLKAQYSSNGATVKMWSRQHIAIMDEIEQNGEYTMSRSKLEIKNGSMTDYYTKLYQWYSQNAALHLGHRPSTDFPIWFNLAEEFKLQPVDDTVSLTLEVPLEEIVLCNYEAWGYVVNYWYVPTDEADEKKHIAMLKQYGLHSDDELFLTDKGNFYPLLKQDVLKSWKRIFTLVPPDLNNSVVGTTWRIKKEWIQDAVFK